MPNPIMNARNFLSFLDFSWPLDYFLDCTRGEI